jgi:hypothetical protein
MASQTHVIAITEGDGASCRLLSRVEKIVALMFCSQANKEIFITFKSSIAD